MHRKTTISEVALSLWRYFRQISITSQMTFLIRFDDSKSPEFDLGPQGSELLCYEPAGISWKQVVYCGQGEGQVEIAGREWGFYWQGAGEFEVVLHDGEIDAAEAFGFVRAVAEKLSGSQLGFKILLTGNSYREI